MGPSRGRLLTGLTAIAIGGAGMAGALAAAAATPAASSRPHKLATCLRKARHGAHPRRAAARCRHLYRGPSPSSRHTTAVSPPGPGVPGSAPPTGSPTSSGTPPPSETPSGGGPPVVPRVQVTAVEYSFSLSRSTVPAGKVILEFVNKGQDEHNLNALAGEGELAASFADEPASAVKDQAVILKPGSYTLFCSLPEHEQKGMRATLLVQ